jgi:hypothetical protein
MVDRFYEKGENQVAWKLKDLDWSHNVMPNIIEFF